MQAHTPGGQTKSLDSASLFAPGTFPGKPTPGSQPAWHWDLGAAVPLQYQW